MKKSRFLLLCLSVASVVFLASCGNKAQTQAGSNANLTVNGENIDLELLSSELAQASTEEDFNSIEKKFAATLGKVGVRITFAHNNRPNNSLYADTDFEFDDNINTMYFGYSSRKDFNILEVCSRANYAQMPCDISLPDGFSIKDDITKLNSISNYYEVLNPFTYGDIYKTEFDLISGFGKSYVAIYLDDQPVNISSYDNKLGTPLNNPQIPFISFHNEMNYNNFLRNPDIPAAVQDLYKHDVLVSIAMDDCFSKLISGDNKKIFLVRVFDSTAPNRDNVGNDIFCYLFEKNTSEQNE